MVDREIESVFGPADPPIARTLGAGDTAAMAGLVGKPVLCRWGSDGWFYPAVVQAPVRFITPAKQPFLTETTPDAACMWHNHGLTSACHAHFPHCSFAVHLAQQSATLPEATAWSGWFPTP